ncbi:MAG: hypothetical protein M9897_13625 [Brumimicrobium sp.]|nr:hypothetical protein [Brumimicrobium sp.]
MNTKEIIISTSLSKKEIEEKLNSVTITDFEQLHASPNAAYYGKISEDIFTIKNVKYSPMSPIPDIQGKITESNKGTEIAVKMDIHSNYTFSKRMYLTTLLPIGLIILLLSYLVLGGTQYQTQGFIFSGVFIFCAIAVVMLTKFSLLSMKKRELTNFAHRVEGKIKEGSEIKLSVLFLHPLIPLSKM